MLKTQEHIEIIKSFERDHKCARLDKEDKSIWPMGRIYQDGRLNELFIAYRQGYALAKCIYHQQAA